MSYLILDTYAEEAMLAIENMEDEVNKFMACGWMPSGGVSVMAFGEGYGCFQAITTNGYGKLPA